MDPALGTQLKDGLDSDTGQRSLVLVTASGKIFRQRAVELEGGTILE